MRIISGRFGGRKLVSFNADHIRPTSDRVKESLFNILAAHWSEAHVLDLYSGTGNLSLEALSWGAVDVVAVEKNSKSIDIIRQNLKLLGIEGECRIVKDDVSRFLDNYSGAAFDIVLVDPPFTEKLAHPTMQTIAQSRVFGDNTIIAIEYSKHEPLEMLYGSLKGFDTRNFGDKLVSFFKKG